MQQDKIQMYPKTSCMLGECKNSYPISSGYKSSLAVEGCQVSPYFDCYGTVKLGEKQTPVESNHITELNREVYTSKLDPSFRGVQCKNGKIACCPKVTYISNDPRQYDTLRAQYLPLDSVPINGDVRLKNIYKNRYDNYGIGFKPYENIDDGQILYYVDKGISDAFYKPVYSEQAKTERILFKDPMGSMKPEYNRIPIKNTENPTVISRKNYPYRLSFLQDTGGFREDIISLQQGKNNRQKWSARWGEDVFLKN